MVQLLGNATKSRKGVRAAVVGWFCPGRGASQLVNNVDEQFVGKVVHDGENLRLGREMMGVLVGWKVTLTGSGEGTTMTRRKGKDLGGNLRQLSGRREEFLLYSD